MSRPDDVRESAETPPTLPHADPLAEDLRELLPPLNATVRARIVDALADIALGELADGSTDDVAKG